MKTFLEVTQTNGDHCGRELVGKCCTKSFWGKFREIREKILCNPKILPAPKTMTKKHLCPRSLLNGQIDKCPSHASIFWRPCANFSTRTLFIRCWRLQFVTVANINYQRYPKTEQFITAKISGNALKQGSRIHLELYQHSSQLQKYKAARMSCWMAVDQQVCSWDGRHPGLTVWNL